MGQDVSTETFDQSIPPSKLSHRDLLAVAEYIKSDDCKNIVFMASPPSPPATAPARARVA